MSVKRPLWFEPFLQEVKKHLGYPVDISKYNTLLRWANENAWGEKDKPFEKLYAVCRVLFLQNHKQEEIFRQLFLEYVLLELAYEESLTEKKPEVVIDEKKIVDTGKKKEQEAMKGKGEDPKPKLTMQEPPDEEEATASTKIKYMNLVLPPEGEGEVNLAASSAGSRFQLTDNYLPLTRREMVHAWRHLRKREQYVMSDVLDIRQTVQQIATQGMLLQPVYEKEQVNSDNLLLILADRKGSMTPFHKLTDTLIETAVKGGGHSKALVYYFYNCPMDVVYKNPNLTGPVTLTELYSMIRPDHTNALIISDAGAARGNSNRKRVLETRKFLYGNSENAGLHKSALFVVWLNPMPRHRWTNTSAQNIANDPDTPMYPVMDDPYLNFLNVVDKLMGKYKGL